MAKAKDLEEADSIDLFYEDEDALGGISKWTPTEQEAESAVIIVQTFYGWIPE